MATGTTELANGPARRTSDPRPARGDAQPAPGLFILDRLRQLRSRGWRLELLRAASTTIGLTLFAVMVAAVADYFLHFREPPLRWLAWLVSSTASSR